MFSTCMYNLRRSSGVTTVVNYFCYYCSVRTCCYIFGNIIIVRRLCFIRSYVRYMFCIKLILVSIRNNISQEDEIKYDDIYKCQ